MPAPRPFVRNRRSRRLPGWRVAIALVALVTTLCACSSGDSTSGPPNPMTIATPNTVGLSQSAATAAINQAGLILGTITMTADNAVPAGDVISQAPAAGTLVNSGTAVNLVVSQGPASVPVPDVVGLSESQASNDIVAAGLLVGTVTRQNDNIVPLDDVISQNPLGGQMVSMNTTVDLVVSLGPTAGAYSDEFNVDSLSDWSLRHVVEGTAAQFTTLDINQTTPGKLTIIPLQTPGWFGDADAPLVFKTLSGNFSVHTHVIADSVSSPGQPPTSNFNSAGLMARNPTGASSPENYIMLNIGRQDGRIPTGVGSETKTTENSSSQLFIDQGSHIGELVLCRIGTQFISYRRLTSDADWIQTTTFVRPDMPGSLQVGLIVNAFSAPADLRAEFDFIRLLPTPAAPADCTP